MSAHVAPDTGFGHGGWVTPTFDLVRNVYPEVRLGRQPDGKLVVGGTAQMPDGDRFCLARYTSNGRADPHFGQDGQVLSKSFGRARALAVNAGQILIGGSSTVDTAGGDLRFAVERFLPDGRPDDSFGTGGAARIDVIPPQGDPLNNEQIQDLAVQSDGGILAAGFAYTQTGGRGALVRLHPDGELDTGFGDPASDAGQQGAVLLPPVSTPPGASEAPDTVFSRIALQADGKIVVGGNYGSWLLAARFSRDGQLDSGNFETDGFVTVQLPHGGIKVGRVIVQPDQKILIVATALSASAGGSQDDETNVLLARLQPDGQLDHSFGEPATPGNLNVRKGWILINVKSLAGEGAFDGALDSQGRIIAVGATESLSGFAGSLLTVRCRPDGFLDQGFSDASGSPGGVVIASIPHGHGHGSACLLSKDHTLTIAGAASFQSGRSGFVLTRYTGF